MNFILSHLLRGHDVHVVVHYSRDPHEAHDRITAALERVIDSRRAIGLSPVILGRLTTGRVGSEVGHSARIIVFDSHRNLLPAVEGRESIVMM